MPDDQGRLFADECAERAGMSPSDWRARVSRGHAPAVADHVVARGAVRAVWDAVDFADYLIDRKARLSARDDREADQSLTDS